MEQCKRLRLAARALANAGLVHAYGHASLRIDDHEFLVTPSMPLGLISVDEAGVKVSGTGDLPADVAGEVLVHQAIYQKRNDVGGICRVQPPKLMTVSCAGGVPQRRHGFGAYLDAVFWDDAQLVRTRPGASALAELLGHRNAVIMRGNGAFVVASTIERAVVLAWYLEDAARVEVELMGIANTDLPVLSDSEAAERATWTGGIEERMWSYLTAGDPESATSS
jgi:HCOMODA/2-hydroxy-3-carboxy-muconic semialdehyde decarboxylase